jgi:hypothetical protein
MSTPSNPRTQEIPVVAPSGPDPGHQPAPAAAPAPPDGVQPTGPVDFVPGLPGTGTPPPPPPSAAGPPLPPPSKGPATAPQPGAQPPVAATTPDADAGKKWPETLDDGEAARPRPVRKARPHRDRDGLALLGLGLAAACLVLLELGLALGFGGTSLWTAIPLWSGFATACAAMALLAFAAFYPAGNRRRSAPAWRVAAAGLVGLAVFWLLVVLPDVASDRGFVLTAALGCLGGALWIGPRRKD